MSAARVPFFRDESRLQALRFHAGELVGTPFEAHQMVPGAGIDCVHVNAWLYLKTRHLEKFDPPPYTLDGGKHADESAVIRWLSTHPLFWPVPILAPEPGDTLCFRQRKSAHHVGLLLPPGDNKALPFIHAQAQYGVRIDDLSEPIHRRALVAIFRPICKEVE